MRTITSRGCRRTSVPEGVNPLTENAQMLEKVDADLAIVFLIVRTLECADGRSRAGACATVDASGIIASFAQLLLDQGNDLAGGGNSRVGGIVELPQNGRWPPMLPQGSPDGLCEVSDQRRIHVLGSRSFGGAAAA